MQAIDKGEKLRIDDTGVCRLSQPKCHQTHESKRTTPRR